MPLKVQITTTVFLEIAKDAMHVSFRSELFTSYILTIFKQCNILPLISEPAKSSYPCMYKYYRKK